MDEVIKTLEASMPAQRLWTKRTGCWGRSSNRSSASVRVYSMSYAMFPIRIRSQRNRELHFDR